MSLSKYKVIKAFNLIRINLVAVNLLQILNINRAFSYILICNQKVLFINIIDAHCMLDLIL